MFYIDTIKNKTEKEKKAFVMFLTTIIVLIAFALWIFALVFDFKNSAYNLNLDRDGFSKLEINEDFKKAVDNSGVILNSLEEKKQQIDIDKPAANDKNK